MDSKVKYKRILLKLSGEALGGTHESGIDTETLSNVAKDVAQVHALGVEIGIVIGGGNIFRGLSAAKWMDRASADYMGMLATVINSLALQDALEKQGVSTRVQSAISMSQIAEPYIRRRAIRHLEKGRAVIFAAGTGNPFFTTDTAASLRAVEINAECLIKGTKVDGVYDKDPVTHKDAKKYDEISYIDVLNQGLKVMDLTAVTLCMDNKLPIITTNLKGHENILKIVLGQNIGTIIK